MPTGMTIVAGVLGLLAFLLVTFGALLEVFQRNRVANDDRVMLRVVDLVSGGSSVNRKRAVYEVAGGPHAGRRGTDRTAYAPPLHAVGDTVPGFVSSNGGHVRSATSRRSTMAIGISLSSVGIGLLVGMVLLIARSRTLP